MKRLIIGLACLLVGLVFFPNSVFAKIGVGVGTGKIQVEEKLTPGLIYSLPILTVLNTGDEPSDYEVSVAFQQSQPELKPLSGWFIFNPQKFFLEPGGVQNVEVKLNLPLQIEPGNYFAYLEAQPVKKAIQGKTTIGVAAASKLYFTVVPANIFQAFYYKIISFYKVYDPWPQRLTFLVILFLGFLLIKRFFNIQINLKKGSNEHSSKSPEFQNQQEEKSGSEEKLQNINREKISPKKKK